MTLLTVVNEACNSVALDGFTSVYGNADATDMYVLANQAGVEIATRVDWSKLLKTQTITASPSALPDGFGRLIKGGAVRTSAGAFVHGVLSPSQWSILTTCTSSQPYYFITGGYIKFLPASAGTSATMDYCSSFWSRPASGDDRGQYMADDDEALFPEVLIVKNMIWRWRRQKGLDYRDQLAEFEAELAAKAKFDAGITT